MNQSFKELFHEYKRELAELVTIAESSPEQFANKIIAASFNREYAKLEALAQLYGQLARKKSRKQDDGNEIFRRN